MKKRRTVKVYVIFIIVLVASFLGASIRLGQIALSDKVDGVDIAAFAKNRNTTTRTLYASRGTIYDINGETLAQTVNSYTVIAYLSPSRTTDEKKPRHVVDKEGTAQKLSEVFASNGITSMTYDHILNLLSFEGYQVELGPGGRNVTEFIKSQIESLELPGIDFMASTKRYYKMADLAPYIVGYARENDDGEIAGEMGIENYYDDELSGENGSITYEADSYGYKLPNSSEKVINPKQGKDIYLTIDSEIQRFLEETIKTLSDEYEMSWLTFTVADAKTGAILGSASNPTFNLNKQNMTSYLDPLVSYQYEPGSTMKIYSFLAAMDNGVYNGDEKYDSGNIKVGDKYLRDFNEIGWGRITFDEGFAYSSNTAASNLALRLGKDKLRDFYDNFGFGKKTGITLPGEVDGIINFNYDTELATAAYGQGITTTPIQNIQALTAIANDGILLKPYIVDKIVDPNTNEVIYQGGREEVGRAAKSESISKIRELMYNAIYSNKTDAKYYQPKNIEMIGKTGTANIPSPNGGYLPGDQYVRSFSGLFPKEDPEYVIYVSVKQFSGPFKKFAGAVVDVVEKIAKHKNLGFIDYEDTTSKIIYLDTYINTLTEDTENKLKALNLNVITLGSGKYVVNVYPKKGSKVLIGDKVFIMTSSNDYVMPDIKNWSENEVVTLCNLIGLKYTISGYGRVDTQSIEAGSPIDLNTSLVVELK